MLQLQHSPFEPKPRRYTRIAYLAIMLLLGLCFTHSISAQDQSPKSKKQGPTTPTAPGATAKSPQASSPFTKAIAYAQKRCVRIYGAGIGREHGYATGLIISTEGHILTAQGIYLSGQRLRVVMKDGKVYLASIIRRSEGLQAAILKISAKTPNFFELADKPIVDKGDWVVAVSNAFKVADRNEDLSVNLGVVTMRAKMDAKHRVQDVNYEGDVLMVDAITSNPGAPGGALITADGRLAGMIGKLIASKSTNTRLNYAVPADQLKIFVTGGDMARFKIGGPPKVTSKPYLGIKLFRLGGKRAPAYIDRVVSGSPADKAGLRRDDMILFIGQQVVRSVTAYDGIFKTLEPKTEISVVVKRGNLIKNTKIIVAKAK
jgi:serine protease Do